MIGQTFRLERAGRIIRPLLNSEGNQVAIVRPAHADGIDKPVKVPGSIR